MHATKPALLCSHLNPVCCLLVTAEAPGKGCCWLHTWEGCKAVAGVRNSREERCSLTPTGPAGGVEISEVKTSTASNTFILKLARRTVDKSLRDTSLGLESFSTKNMNHLARNRIRSQRSLIASYLQTDLLPPSCRPHLGISDGSVTWRASCQCCCIQNYSYSLGKERKVKN